MHIPDITSPDDASETTNASESWVTEFPEPTERGWRPRRFGKPSPILSVPHDATRPTQTEQQETHGLDERASGCPRGKTFYRCENGFRGCCAHDPCNPGGSCRDGERASLETEKTKTTTKAEKTTSHLSSHHATETRHISTPSVVHSEPMHSPHTVVSHTTTPHTTSHITSHRTPSILAAFPTSKPSSATSSLPGTAATPPTCPAANGTHYIDSSKIAYTILCNTDNTYSPDNTIAVGTGGYGECFSACSRTDTCAGFTYVGHDSGNCYLRGQMPNDTYVPKAGNNYVFCAKLDPTAASGNSTIIGGKPDSSNTPKKAGIIAGAVIGGVLLFALLLSLIAFCAKRHRKKVEKRRATITHVIQGPIETQQLSSPGHQRTGSTSHDVFQPFGGFHRGFSVALFDQSVQDELSNAGGSSEVEVVSSEQHNMPPGVKAESGLMYLPTTVYQRPQKLAQQEVGVPDGAPIKRPDSRESGSRSPRFHQHLPELNDTSSHSPSQRSASQIDSPTLGRHPGRTPPAILANDLRRRQHLMSRTNYSSGQSDNYTENEDAVSVIKDSRAVPSTTILQETGPKSSDEPQDSGLVVAPLFSSRSRYGK